MGSLRQLRHDTLRALGVGGSDRFTLAGLSHDDTTVRLEWELEGVGTLHEDLEFHGVRLTGHGQRRTSAIAAALRLVHLVAGVSYLKVTLPGSIDTGPLSSAQRDLVLAVLVDGLAELAWDHDVDLSDHFVLPPATRSSAAAPDLAPDMGPLVPVGGGKDSIVTLTALAGLSPTLFAVNPRGPILRTFERAGMPSVTVTRTLDPRLFDLNERGAINGHVPITAIVSAIAVVAAVAGGHDAVVLSNEASADEPTLVLPDGRAVNHQWSKSSAFERRFASLVHDEVAADLDYLSLLRPASELWIARRFAQLGRWDRVFNSCNRAFHLRGERREWCGECPKCRFVFLALAPFMQRDRIVGIMGRNLLDDGGQVDDFAALVGLTEHKPFECVGEADESAAALAHLASRPEWASDVVVAALAPRLAVGPGAIDAFLGDPDVTALPDRLGPALLAEPRAAGDMRADSA